MSENVAIYEGKLQLLTAKYLLKCAADPVLVRSSGDIFFKSVMMPARLVPCGRWIHNGPSSHNVCSLPENPWATNTDYSKRTEVDTWKHRRIFHLDRNWSELEYQKPAVWYSTRVMPGESPQHRFFLCFGPASSKLGCFVAKHCRRGNETGIEVTVWQQVSLDCFFSNKTAFYGKKTTTQCSAQYHCFYNVTRLLLMNTHYCINITYSEHILLIIIIPTDTAFIIICNIPDNSSKGLTQSLLCFQTSLFTVELSAVQQCSCQNVYILNVYLYIHLNFHYLVTFLTRQW